MAVAGELVFVREDGFPRQWSVIRRSSGARVGILTQEHERNEHGKSVFRYRAALLPHRQLGSFASLRQAKQAVTDALESA